MCSFCFQSNSHVLNLTELNYLASAFALQYSVCSAPCCFLVLTFTYKFNIPSFSPVSHCTQTSIGFGPIIDQDGHDMCAVGLLGLMQKMRAEFATLAVTLTQQASWSHGIVDNISCGILQRDY